MRNVKKPASSKTNKKAESVNEKDSYSVENCFMFDEEDTPKSTTNNDKSVTFGQSRIIEFRPDKPYRLALYVQPVVKKRKLDPSNSNILAKISEMRKNRNKENISKCIQTKLTMKPKEKLSVALFDEEAEASNKQGKTHNILQIEKPVLKDSNVRKVSPKSILSEVDVNETQQKSTNEINLKYLPKTKQKKIRRSYEKKFKEYKETENVVEPPSEEILKEIDMQKITRSKIRKPNKEDQEFEKWAQNMNSAFDDIDKFELSIIHD